MFAATPGSEVGLLGHTSRAAAAKALAPFMPLFVQPDEFSGHARIRLVFCIESIDEILAPGRVPDPLLSTMLGHTANHSRKLLLTQLAFLLTMLDRQEHLSVALLPKKQFERFPIGCIGSAGHFFAAWLPDTGESAYFPFANSLFNAGDLFASFWNSLPASSYDRRTVKRILSRWLRRNGVALPQPRRER